MGRGGSRAACRDTLLIISAILLGLALVCAVVGGILYGTSKGLTAISKAHATKKLKIDAKLESLRKNSKASAEKTMKIANIMFIVAGSLAGASVLSLFVACVCLRRPTGQMPPPVPFDPPPGSYPVQGPPPPAQGGGYPPPQGVPLDMPENMNMQGMEQPLTVTDEERGPTMM